MWVIKYSCGIQREFSVLTSGQAARVQFLRDRWSYGYAPGTIGPSGLGSWGLGTGLGLISAGNMGRH